MKTPSAIPRPDPIQESELDLTLQWTPHDRTAKAIDRQAETHGHASGRGFDSLHPLIS